ncbi:MAG: acetamidase/formamidase family protein [Thermoplasmata archaeon]|nr:acetamidase/formamidase family protein [Thermoplasmata archaeon]
MTLRIDGRRAENLQRSWRSDREPILVVEPGAVVEIEVPDSSGAQLTETSTRADLASMDLTRVDPAVGPIDVRGAEPGDALVVELLEIVPGGWGWSGIFREFGLIQGRFDPDLVLWKLRDGWATPASGFLRDLRLPLRPMLGVIAVAPASGEYPMIPPERFGGNMDNPLQCAGTRVELPVLRAGAGLSVGDPHALQGNGEVCGTGIETSARVRLRVDLRPGQAPPFPRIEGHEETLPSREIVSATGIGPDLHAAARAAVENLLDRLVELGWSYEEGYLLTSLVGDLRIAEIVDEPNFVVSAVFPAELARLPERSARPAGRS